MQKRIKTKQKGGAPWEAPPLVLRLSLNEGSELCFGTHVEEPTNVVINARTKTSTVEA